MFQGILSESIMAEDQDEIGEVQFLYVFRDIFGINLYIDEPKPELFSPVPE